jgi:hypothetical protein
MSAASNKKVSPVILTKFERIFSPFNGKVLKEFLRIH